MSFIDLTYFEGEISIPFKHNTDGFESNYIVKYERQYLIYVLGFQLYNEFIAGLAEPVPAQKWLDLRDGVQYTYTYQGQTILTEWIGFANMLKTSPIAYYVYYKWIIENYNQLTRVGVTDTESDNATKTTPFQKGVNAYNRMLDLTGRYPCTTSHRGSFTVINPQVYSNLHDDKSLLHFLSVKHTEYENWRYTQLEDMNILGI